MFVGKNSVVLRKYLIVLGFFESFLLLFQFSSNSHMNRFEQILKFNNLLNPAGET